MLPQAFRLRKEKEIKGVLQRAKTRKSGLLVCKTAANNLDAVRFCFIVSKKISNKAVVRNKLKRRLRAIVQKFLPNAILGYDCLLIACPGLQKTTFGELESTVKKALESSNIIKL